MICRISEVDESKVKLDLKDRKILTLLSENSRMPLSEIAEKVMLSRDGVNYRIKRMQKLGVIISFFPEINYELFGFNEYHVFLLLYAPEEKVLEEFKQALINHPNIINILEYADRWDFEIVLLAKTIKEFDKIITKIISDFPGILLEKEKLEVVERYCHSYLPTNVAVNPNYKRACVSETKLDVDEKDIKILRLLSEDARVSTYKIAEKVKLSADAVSYRIKKLVNNGVILGFTILTNITLLENNWYTFVIQLESLDEKSESRLREFIRHPYILSATKILGKWDLLMYLTTTKPKNLMKTIREIKVEFANIIKGYEIWMAYRELKFVTFPDVLEPATKSK